MKLEGRRMTERRKCEKEVKERVNYPESSKTRGKNYLWIFIFKGSMAWGRN